MVVWLLGLVLCVVDGDFDGDLVRVVFVFGGVVAVIVVCELLQAVVIVVSS